MSEFSPAVREQWIDPFEGPAPIRDTGALRLAAADLGEGMGIQLLLRPDRTCAVATPAVLALPGVAQAATEEELRRALTDAGLTMNGPDHLFFLPVSGRKKLCDSAPSDSVRLLTEDDSEIFQAFQHDIPKPDRDESFVELDHWLVMGAFAGDTLATAASAYPFHERTSMADIGVVTRPDARGRGHGRRLVTELARQILLRGLEPQYRCGLENVASAALAKSVGFVELGTWDVPTPPAAPEPLTG